MLKQHLQQNIASRRNHPELLIEQRLVGLHGLLLPPSVEKPIHKRRIHNPIIHQTPLLKLVEKLIGLLQILQIEKPRNQIVENQRIRAMAFVQHFPQEINGFPNPAGVDQPLRQVPEGNRRRAEGRIGDDMAIDLETDVNSALVAMGIDQIIVRDNVGDDVGLVEEELEEGNCVTVPLGAVHGSDDGVAGEDGGAGVGEDGVAGDG
ncbi:hypothetical protein TorRG33x02_234940, partial [Trema orientale]